MITHFVVMRTQNAAYQKELLEGLESLKAIKHAISVHFGVPVPSPRPVVDDTFTVGLSVVCEDVQSLNAYLVDPIHQAFGQNYLQKYGVKITVNDIES